MTPEQVRERVRQIAALQGDPEAAHGSEDGLWFDVLLAIADGADRPEQLAEEALKTAQLDFERWHA